MAGVATTGFPADRRSAMVETTSRISFIRATPLRDDVNERNAIFAKLPERHGNSPSALAAALAFPVHSRRSFQSFPSLMKMPDRNARPAEDASRATVNRPRRHGTADLVRKRRRGTSR